MTEATTAGSLADGPTIDEREARLATGARALAAGTRNAVLRNPHLLLGVAATLMLVGVVAIIVAWVGIAHSTMVEQQLAYLVSGGILGLALAMIGALTFLSHWLTVLVRATHEQTELLREMRDRDAARQSAPGKDKKR